MSENMNSSQDDQQVVTAEHSASIQAVPAKRTVILYSTRGENKKKIETDATTWGQLKGLVTQNGFNIGKLHATESVTKGDLVNDHALLPAGPFTIFFRNKETKSGADRKALFAQIKEAIEKNPAMKQNFIVDGKNMTQLPTTLLEELVGKHLGGASPSTSASEAPKKEKKEGKKGSFGTPVKEQAVETDGVTEAGSNNGVGDVVESVAESKHDNAQTSAKIRVLLKTISGSSDVMDRVSKIDAELDKLDKAIAESNKVETPEEKAAREQREADAEEDRQLKAQAKMLGF